MVRSRDLERDSMKLIDGKQYVKGPRNERIIPESVNSGECSTISLNVS